MTSKVFAKSFSSVSRYGTSRLEAKLRIRFVRNSCYVAHPIQVRLGRVTDCREHLVASSMSYR